MSPMKSNLSGTDFKSTNLDMLLAVLATAGLPLVCGRLYDRTGAALPLFIYYGLFCVALVKWRKGTLDYRWPRKLVTPLFAGLCVIQLFIFYTSSKIVIPVAGFSPAGLMATLAVWAPLNAFTEQLLWLYVYDSFANRFADRTRRIIFSGLGIVFYWGVIALIHILFWSKFMMAFNTTAPFWQIFMGLQYPLTIGYIIIYRKTGSMYPVALLHLFQDVTGVLLARYSIIPYLIK